MLQKDKRAGGGEEEQTTDRIKNLLNQGSKKVTSSPGW